METWFDECDSFKVVHIQWIFGVVQCAEEGTTLRFTNLLGDTIGLQFCDGCFVLNVNECHDQSLVAVMFAILAYERKLNIITRCNSCSYVGEEYSR